MKKGEGSHNPKNDYKKSNAGRPTKYTAELAERIIDLIRKGAYIETAAAACGVHKGAFYDWLRRSEKGEEPYAGFSHAVERAAAESELSFADIIDKAAKTGQWQAAAWRLERKFPNRYGLKNRLEVTGEDGKAIKIEFGKDIDGI